MEATQLAQLTVYVLSTMTKLPKHSGWNGIFLRRKRERSLHLCYSNDTVLTSMASSGKLEVDWMSEQDPRIRLLAVRVIIHLREYSVSSVLCLTWLCVSVSYKGNY